MGSAVNRAPPANESRGDLPLEGLRVVDFGIITAGASTSAMLADLGAEVIKVEGPGYIDPFRHWAGESTEAGWWEGSPHFRFTNRNKQDVCVDLKSESGRELLLDLVRISDVVIENFRAGVLDRLGLGFDVLRGANSRIVLGSVSSQGTTGPNATAVSFGSTLEASSGFADLVRYPGEAPMISGQALNYPDQVVSLFAAGMIMATVLEARRSGRALHVDIAQREVTAFLIGEKLVAAAYGVNDSAGGACECGALHGGQGIYPSADGRWVAATLVRKTDPARVDALTGGSGLAALELWIASQPAAIAVAGLRAAGCAAEIALTAADMVDAHHPAQDRLAVVLGPDGTPVKGLPWSTDGRPLQVRSLAPTLGQDNRRIVIDLLKRDEATYNDLVAHGILATAPTR
ncbi:crotonobetainyl-CoA:carnitine CoA-transferase CaiB-like acyl-CoA transferase [Hoeflea marina]|uniref:Crotonobetainyl-CoA:carnitine CoA-transferase CaiB-like acyl-CoA transferase n=1 Tax=Hoeflea marina TaxID=274592 RepID=A0A317PHA3_9HYPH|nr:CoA transferase [Hoeflea marina]PWV98828.1 crotonobetainyl-CoA:carnitine CoA-transferase CaiB-like acyl-CoA transferase [Hoeflea marina]